MDDQNLPAKTSDASTDEPRPKRISSKELFGDSRKILIKHGPTDYLLSITRQGKLILTK